GWLPNAYESYSAGTDTRLVVLADGSRAELNLGTELTYANYKDGRSVTLSKGEAFFEVQPRQHASVCGDAGQGSIESRARRFE
ncbi:peptide ABC transporter substrate-binding protein, partial [Pseudomonas syringae pv. actinidiae]|nr:peptide ABC transporter substrate-binding protein [Pseudomonas syringae pv. actinidiae]